VSPGVPLRAARTAEARSGSRSSIRSRDCVARPLSACKRPPVNEATCQAERVRGGTVGSIDTIEPDILLAVVDTVEHHWDVCER
jgi:hypothetical protein